MMKMSPNGLNLLKEFEGLRLTAYICIAGIPTIGYGSTKGVTIDDVKAKLTITKEEAEQRLIEDLHAYEYCVSQNTVTAINQHEFDALVCLAYNIGANGFKSSTVLKAHNKGNKEACAKAFMLWNKATVNGKKQEVAGLTRRRMAEAALYLKPVAIAGFKPVIEMPQQVENERPLTESTINRASVVAGTTATVAAVTEVVNSIHGLKNGVESLGNWFVPILLVAVVGLCGFIIWQRFDMRNKGIV